MKNESFVHEDSHVNPQQRGVFRDPEHVAKVR